MTAALLAGLVAGLGIALPVGAIGMYLVSLGARAPRPVATAAALGVASTDGAYALLAVVAGANLQSILSPVRAELRWISVLALLVLAAVTITAGVRGLRQPIRPEAPVSRMVATPHRAFGTLFALTALNPATLAYFTALVLGHESGAMHTSAERVGFVLAVLAASAAWQLLLVATGTLVGHVAGGRRGQLAVAVVSGAVMVGLAVRVAS